MSTFKLFLENFNRPLVLDLASINAAEYQWIFCATHGVYRLTDGKREYLVYFIKGPGRFFLANGLPYDYRLANIREFQVNKEQYQKLANRCSSRYKGVTYVGKRQAKTWLAQKSCQGNRVLQKYFHTEIEAAQAYNKATIECLGHQEAFFGKHLNEF